MLNAEFGMSRLSSLLWLLCCSLLLIATNSQVTHPLEVSALRDIKRSLIDPNHNLSNWNHGDPCAFNWTGVQCFNQTLDDGYLHVRELQLLNLGLAGSLSPALGRLSYMKILDFMWNKLSGSIPPEIGNIKSLELLLLNGNQLTGSLPEEIGHLPVLDRIQIDQNLISGPIPKSFANLDRIKHLHMNNNSITGQIPPELSKLKSLVHLLLDNNNLSGYIPAELAEIQNLLILQLDNNHFDGTIPSDFGNMSKLLKLSLRNCSLQGPIPDLSRIPNLAYIDLSLNQLQGFMPSNKLSEAITTINLSNNNLTGTIPANFSGFPQLQRLYISNNSLSGSIPSTIWRNWNSTGNGRLILNLQNNNLSDISGNPNLPPNVTLWLQGNPICSSTNLIQLCGTQSTDVSNIQSARITTDACPAQACPPPYEYAPESSVPCFCAAPLIVGYRLKSPGFSDFLPYLDPFEAYLTSGLKTKLYQLEVESFEWQNGPRLKMTLKIFPVYIDNSSYIFNRSEVLRIRGLFTRWKLPNSEVFGPYELLNFTLLDPYKDVIRTSSSSSITKGALAGIVLGAIAGTVTLSAIVSCIILRLHTRKHHGSSKRRQLSRVSMKIDGVKDFTYAEMALATKKFSSSTQVGQGGYGFVYKGFLADGRVVAIKCAQEGSLQGEKEFLTEIELLSRLHHRNLVSLIGYCDDGEQMLVYEFMPNGTVRDHLSGMSSESLSFAMRTRIALDSAKGILYLHTEADPPILHRDIKTSNILLDQNLTAKVADFGLSRLAPVPDKEGLLPAYISTVVKGTPGYLDPEYLLTHKLTDKSDVYSLGVVILELLTGMQPISRGKNIVREVNNAYRCGLTFSVIDEQMGSYPSECVEKFVTLALNCCKEDTNERPSMAEVVRELETIWYMLPESDISTADRSASGPKPVVPVQSLSSLTKNPYISAEVSGSDLVSGVVHTITPR